MSEIDMSGLDDILGDDDFDIGKLVKVIETLKKGEEPKKTIPSGIESELNASLDAIVPIITGLVSSFGNNKAALDNLAEVAQIIQVIKLLKGAY